MECSFEHSIHREKIGHGFKHTSDIFSVTLFMEFFRKAVWRLKSILVVICEKDNVHLKTTCPPGDSLVSSKAITPETQPPRWTGVSEV